MSNINFNVISKAVLKHEIIKKVLYGTTLSKGWTSKGVVPDVIDKVPPRKLGVQYPDININEGNLVKPTQVQSEPQVSWKAKQGTFYTLCMVDVDAPNRNEPSMREWLNWLVVNIPENDTDKGEVMAEYVGACPPQDSGLHRYVLLLYHQPEKLTCPNRKLTNKSGKGRANFCIRKFIKKYSLKEVIAGNFFEAEYDEYVQELHKQLGFS